MSDSRRFQVFVRVPVDRKFKTFTIDLNENGYVRDIAEKLANKTSMPPQLVSSIALQYRSKLLDHEKSICAYSIHSESTLSANFRGTDSNNSHISSFPASVSHQRLLGEVIGIERELVHLENKYKHKMARSNSLESLGRIRKEIQNAFNQKRTRLISKKLNLYKNIQSNEDQKKHSLEYELGLICHEREQIKGKHQSLVARIKHHQDMIYKLEIEKASNLEKDIATEQEYKLKCQIMKDLQQQISENHVKVNEAQNELNDSECNESIQSNVLSQSFAGALGRQESKFMEWSANDVVDWLMLIENGRFNQDKYGAMMNDIKKLKINGESIKDLRNEPFLKLIGGGVLNLMDRQTLIKNIDRVVNGGNGEQKSNCTICVVARINSVFLPCGHQSACFECFQRERNRFRKCPICRNDVTNVVRTFMNGF